MNCRIICLARIAIAAMLLPGSLGAVASRRLISTSRSTAARLKPQYMMNKKLRCKASGSSSSSSSSEIIIPQAHRRRNVFKSVGLLTSLMPMAILKARKAAGADVDVGGVTVSTIKDGLEGSRGAQAGDWVLISYQGKIKATGQVFDSTRGGLTYMNGGVAEYQPRLFQLNAKNPQPGIVSGLYKAIEGMKVGEIRKADISAAEGYGDMAVVGPFAEVPARSDLEYEIQILRMGRDIQRMLRATSRCGAGGQAAQTSGCRDIEPLVTE
mmetsp:Transcript_1383/g.1874  ORF Transcript_1383/g.1874 Transcript_1383/m.1874 type:complete len:268 (+) Transcript_1383:138-941(+)